MAADKKKTTADIFSEVRRIAAKQNQDEATMEMKDALRTMLSEVGIDITKYENLTRKIEELAAMGKSPNFIKAMDDLVVYVKEIQSLIKEWERLQPYVEAELKKPEYGGKTLDEIAEQGGCDLDTNNGVIPGGILDKLLTAAYTAMEADTKRQGLPTAAIKRADLVEYPLDKVNSGVWQLLQEDTGGQVAFKAEKTGSKKQLNIYYSINFEDLTNTNGVTITKQLLPFDKRVYIAVSALFNSGNNIITLTQIHYAMGNSKRPNAKQLQKIYDSVKKMTTARISVDTAEEAAVYKGYSMFKYSGSLMPVEDIQAIVNGQLADAAIHLFREPPLITFAKERKQVTTVSVALLDSPISKTAANIAIDDYLIERIARAAKGKQPAKILYKTLYENAGIITKMQRSRAPEKIEKYLNHYKTQDFIKGYTMEVDGITVYFADKK